MNVVKHVQLGFLLDRDQGQLSKVVADVPEPELPVLGAGEQSRLVLREGDGRDESGMSSQVRDLCAHDEIPHFELAVLRA